ncbi:MAG: hypothetical protein II430_02470 [Selenomonas sp.]|nr:hypothetical protein [Selenomonas sp.]MBQ2136795.1 hypothetical protein [Selenomonas sp.]MBQ5418713.1 hypothetical protein [Selenomonas sp.]
MGFDSLRDKFVFDIFHQTYPHNG